MSKATKWVVAAGAGCLVAACGGGGDDSAAAEPAPKPVAATMQGVFLDAAVEGLAYAAGTAAQAFTDAAGHFSCQAGQAVSFQLAGIALGSAPCAELLTPLELAVSTPDGIGGDAVLNRALLLQALDDDGDPDNGIRLSADLQAALAGKAIDVNAAAADFDTALNTTLAALPEPYSTRSVDGSRRQLAREHFENTLASKTSKPEVQTVAEDTAFGRVSAQITRYRVQADASFQVPYEGKSAKTRAEFPQGFLPAYGSGLAFKGQATDGTLEFYAITDRGPNGDGPNAPVPGQDGVLSISKVFPAPSFAPSFGLIRVGRDGAVLSQRTTLKRDATHPITGLPPQSGAGATGETPLTDAYVFDAAQANFDANGLDPETLVLDAKRQALWSSDEYGPFIVRINATTGVIEKKYGPGTGAGSLPAVLAQRRVNRGMEGLTLDVASGHLHGFLQSPIDPKDSKGKSLKAKPPGGSNTDVRHIAKFTRWVEFDPATESSRLYAYPIDGSSYDKDRTGNAKLGDVVSLGDGRFLVIEQGAGKKDGAVMHKLVLVEIPADATDIAALDHNLEISSITQAPAGDADYSKVVTLKKTELFDLNAAGWLAEKAEGLTLVDERTIALVNDNDFGLRTVLTDDKGKTVSGSIEDCTVDAAGAIVSGCPDGASAARLVRGTDLERPSRLWLLRFDRPFKDYAAGGASR